MNLGDRRLVYKDAWHCENCGYFELLVRKPSQNIDTPFWVRCVITENCTCSLYVRLVSYPLPERQLPQDASRLRRDSTSGYVARHTSGGCNSGGTSAPPPPRNNNSSPPGFMNACRPLKTRASTLTARSVRTSCASCNSGRVRSTSYRPVSTDVRSNSRRRTTSRRKAAFRVLPPPSAGTRQARPASTESLASPHPIQCRRLSPSALADAAPPPAAPQ